MKKAVTAICHHEYGSPEEVAQIEAWDLPPIAPNQVLVEMKASPINPADINVLEGKYPVRPPLPAIVGNEGVGIIAQTGSAVSNFRIGQPVISLNRVGNWCEAYVGDVNDLDKIGIQSNLIALPDNIPLEQAAMLSVNPPTAWRMLEAFVDLKPNDWVIQNAANSGVGRAVIQIARLRGLRTVNVVRRKELIPELEAAGADVVITDEIPLSKQIRDLTGNANVPLGLNAIGGESAREIAKSLSDHATLVTYGAMGLQPLQMSNSLLIFKDLQFRGFWINAWYKRADTREIRDMFDRLIPLVTSGKLKVPVEKTYPLTDAKDALVHACQSRRKGKILFVMD